MNDLDQHEWKVTIGHDDSTENPLIYSDFVLVDFRDSRARWSSYSADALLDCTFEDENDTCEARPESHNDASFASDLYMDRHPFLPNQSIVAYLDFSGGSSAGIRWYLTEGTCSLPGYPAIYDSGRYGNEPAGVLTWQDQDDHGFWAWLKDRDNAAKTSMEQASEQLDEYVKAVLDEYNKWASGETYWFMIERLNDEGDYEEFESCGGYYGWDHMKDGLLDMGMPEEVVKAEDWELIESYY